MSQTIRQLLVDAAEKLKPVAAERAAFEARLLLAKILNKENVWLIQESETLVAAEDSSEFWELVERRKQSEPMAYLLGEKEFFARKFFVNSSVLIPRPETESLVMHSLTWMNQRGPALRVLELGVGSGCILLSLALERKSSQDRYFGVDLSERALCVARKNAESLNAENIQFQQMDILRESPSENFDLIVSNPPYIPSKNLNELAKDIRDFEPQEALDGGLDGLQFYRRILEIYWPLLSPGGLLAMETYNESQRKFITDSLTKFVSVNIWIEDCHIFCERKD